MADPSPPAPRRRPAWAMLVVGLIVLAVFAILVVAPELPRRLFGGTAALPNGPGDEPTRPGRISDGRLPERDPGMLPIPPGDVSTRKDQDRPPQPAPAPAPDAKVPGKPTAVIAPSAPTVAQLIAALDDRDELVRTWDTHPALLRLEGHGKVALVVPLLSLDDPLQPVVDAPMAWVEGQRTRGQRGAFLLKGVQQFSRAELDLDGMTVTPIDQRELHRQLMAQLDARLNALHADPESERDPLAWYAAGRFAYRNRLDEQTDRLLQRALELDPQLKTTVRENAANALCGSMLSHLRCGNMQQALGFLNTIERRFPGSAGAKRARLAYDGRATRPAAIPASAPAPVAVAAAPAPVTAPTEPPPPVANGGLGTARSQFDAGSQLTNTATTMPLGDERNRILHQAKDLLSRARSAFAAHCTAHPEDAATQGELDDCSTILVLIRRMLTY